MQFQLWNMAIFSILVPFLLNACAGIQSRYHTVRPGETVYSIAQYYKIPLQHIRARNEQILRRPLHAGTKLYVPFEKSPGWDALPEDHSTRVLYRSPTRELQSVTFTWPVQGFISSSFGRRRGEMHDGIDIVAREGTEVRAARSGHVIYATNRISGYGNMVILRHSDSFSSVYAHLSRFDVRKGQFVTRGQRIGGVGRTGHATNPHLHFEVRNNRSPVNPLLYLQGQYATNILR